MQVVVFLSHVLQASHTFLQHLLLSYCFYYVFYIIIHYWLLIQQKKSLFFNGLAKKCTIMQKNCRHSFRNMQNENCCYGKNKRCTKMKKKLVFRFLVCDKVVVATARIESLRASDSNEHLQIFS